MSGDDERAARRQLRELQRERKLKREQAGKTKPAAPVATPQATVAAPLTATPQVAATREVVATSQVTSASRAVPHGPPYGTRLGAGLIDLLLACVPLLVLFFAVGNTAPAGTIGLGGSLDINIGSTEHYLTGGQEALFAVMIVAVWAIVFGLLPAWFGGTIGMKSLGLGVAGADGGPVPPGGHLKRTAMWVVDGFPYVLPGLLGLVWIVATPGRRRAGDYVAKTAVVRTRAWELAGQPPTPTPESAPASESRGQT